jgi:transposase
VGIDDWAKRKGRSDGTILVDLERRVPIELLSDREEATVRQWLEAHPEVQIICRDRAPQYAEAARLGAPQAIQVVDRWHLLKNLGEAVQRILTRHRQQMEEATWRMRDAQSTSAPTLFSLPSLSSTEANEIARHRANRSARYQAVKELQAQGVSLHGIARTLVMSPNTVRRYVRASTSPNGLAIGRRVASTPICPTFMLGGGKGSTIPLSSGKKSAAKAIRARHG